MNLEMRMTSSQRQHLLEHLFCGDGEEHGAVLACGIARTDRGVRLLVRKTFLAADGVDFVASENAHRALSARFVAETSDYCQEHGYAWLSVHNHGPGDSVGFSDPDRRSHRRLYPSLEQYIGQPVGALVFADRAAAGEVRLDGRVTPLRRVTTVGDRIEHLYPRPPFSPTKTSRYYDRQVLLFGARGQEILRDMKVVVVGGGGAGSIVCLQLARLGVGELVVIDPDRVSVSNLSRIPGARRLDALAWLASSSWPAARRIAARFARPKVSVIGREARRANPTGLYRGIFGDVMSSEVARELASGDFIFCATDTMASRMLVNVVAHQYLVPAIQLGTKVPVSRDGEVGIIHLAVRPITVEAGCLDCAGVISQRLLHNESLQPDERRRHRYIDDPDVPEPSVITLNTEVAGRAVTDFLFMVCGLHHRDTSMLHEMYEPRERELTPTRFQPDPMCSCCSTREHSRFALGDGRALPTHR
jgi:molybdopterin/thiamine biosynthesis adenylyltransferase